MVLNVNAAQNSNPSCWLDKHDVCQAGDFHTLNHLSLSLSLHAYIYIYIYMYTHTLILAYPSNRCSGSCTELLVYFVFLLPRVAALKDTFGWVSFLVFHDIY